MLHRAGITNNCPPRHHGRGSQIARTMNSGRVIKIKNNFKKYRVDKFHIPILENRKDCVPRYCIVPVPTGTALPTSNWKNYQYQPLAIITNQPPAIKTRHTSSSTFIKPLFAFQPNNTNSTFSSQSSAPPWLTIRPFNPTKAPFFIGIVVRFFCQSQFILGRSIYPTIIHSFICGLHAWEKCSSSKQSRCCQG